MAVFIRQLSDKGIIIGLAIGLLLTTYSRLNAATPEIGKSLSENFPVHASIKPNVAFWTDIFTRYTRAQGVIHDTRNLDRVYGIITLDPAYTRTAAKKNKNKKKAVLESYKKILLALGNGALPSTQKEKKVAKLFAGKASPESFKRAARDLRCQTGLAMQFKEGLIRSGAVIDQIKGIFKSHGLPMDLVYLPCVESSFDFTAYSKFGAAGIWQFTRGTGKRYMEIGYVVDQRRDPIISTQAAARLLKRNYEKLGEWPLAITAYNHGVNGMLRAKQQKGGYENIFNTFQSRSFKFASRNFYSEFLAASHVAKNYKRYFGDLTFQKPVQFTPFTAKGYLPVKDLAKGLNLDIQTIKSLNPSLRKPIFDGRKYIPSGFEVRLPKSLSQESITRVAAGLYKKKQKPSKFHQVQKGDTAGAIARTHTISLKDLILANGLNSKATVYIGQNLRIPVQGEVILTKKQTKAKPKKTADTTQVLAKKDSFLQASAKSLVSKPKILEPNILKPKALKPLLPKKLAPEQVAGAGTEIAKPLPLETKTLVTSILETHDINLEIVTSNLKIQKTFIKENRLKGIIRVAPEETLGHYADWIQVPTQEIRTLNGFPFGKPISIDQEIIIPLAKAGQERFEELRYEHHKEIEEDFFESFLIDGVETYEIKNGDTIWSLCLNELEIPLWLLKKFNPAMDFNVLQPLQKISYPVINKLL
jgi:membrane-bound lytic murein transglycosylase D